MDEKNIWKRMEYKEEIEKSVSEDKCVPTRCLQLTTILKAAYKQKYGYCNIF